MKELLMSSGNSIVSYALKNLSELVSVRRSSGLTLQQISDSTKISMRYLQAIEDGILGKLPATIRWSVHEELSSPICRGLPKLTGQKLGVLVATDVQRSRSLK
jgi:hypothetical protein